MSLKFILSRSWQTAAPPPLRVIAEKLTNQVKLREDEASDECHTTLRGGSQLRTRLLGGWFIQPRHLPKEVRVSAHATPNGYRLDAVVEDALGPVAVRDRFFAKRYEMAAEEVFALIDAVLSPHGS